METSEVLRTRLQKLDGQDYGRYQSLRGAWRFDGFELHIDRIPKDPYAPPHTGVYRVRVPIALAGFLDWMLAPRVREVALRDFLARRAFSQCQQVCPGRRGTGNSGVITIAEPGQEILERSSIVLSDGCLEARLFLGLPAEGRKIRAAVAAAMLFDELPRIVEASLFLVRLELTALETHLQTAEDSDTLRNHLAARGLVAFVADGALLPRRSGVDPRRTDAPGAVPFRSPASLRVSFALPNRGQVNGMGIPEGLTLIVGGGYHGKSTLLQALELGVYDHIPGDGRELCVSRADAAKIRAANGRGITGTDISAFIRHIPQGQDTVCFHTSNASGSTSQAASLCEAVEAGTSLLLMDEDSSATNFMIRDKRMQELVAKRHEPITAYIDRVRQLHQSLGISSILVMGGSGDYFDGADCVIQMIEYQPRDVTARAHEIAASIKTGRIGEGVGELRALGSRRPLGGELDHYNEYGHSRITATTPDQLTYGSNLVDLSDMEQIVEAAQVRAIGRAIRQATDSMDGQQTLRQIVTGLMEQIGKGGLDLLDPDRTGNLALFRPLEFAGTLNRMRCLQVATAETQAVDRL